MPTNDNKQLANMILFNEVAMSNGSYLMSFDFKKMLFRLLFQLDYGVPGNSGTIKLLHYEIMS